MDIQATAMNLHDSNELIAKISPTTSASPSIGAILIDAGRLSAEGAEQILRLQKEGGLRFGDAALQLGLVNEDDIRFALSRQFDYPYLQAGDTSLSHELVAAFKPFSHTVENLRVLRSQLMLRWFSNAPGHKALTILSPGTGDGCSFVAANLAVVFSQLGERTLLIDANLRTPRQHQLFKLSGTAGLSDMLAGRAGLEAVIRIPSLVGLSVLPAGAIPPNPQELLGRQAFNEILITLGKSFDVILIDSPAAADYADAQTIAARTGAALMVARKNKSALPAMSHIANSLQDSGVTLVGAALNDA